MSDGRSMFREIDDRIAAKDAEIASLRAAIGDCQTDAYSILNGVYGDADDEVMKAAERIMERCAALASLAPATSPEPKGKQDSDSDYERGIQRGKHLARLEMLAADPQRTAERRVIEAAREWDRRKNEYSDALGDTCKETKVLDLMLSRLLVSEAEFWRLVSLAPRGLSALPAPPQAGRTDPTERLLNVARGCLDYGGGYRADERALSIFHHGVQTVINALEAAAKNDPTDTQVNALEVIGRDALVKEPRS